MPTTRRSDQKNVGIGCYRGIAQRGEWDEGIVLCVNDQSGNPYPANEGKRAGFCIIVVDSCETESRRGVALIKLSESSRDWKRLRFVKVRIEILLEVDASLQTSYEVVMINPVSPFTDKLRAGTQINRRRNGANA